ncbi:MAG: type II secretion system GspH family protein [Kiritimatiellae bacterium]|nr:type II secretion system GspH family protein [Kiritimatiellia bacterium]
MRDSRLMRRCTAHGFTLTELMIVAVIVAILAAVAVPLMEVNRKRAMITEAEAGLGTIRNAWRAMYAETRNYSRTPNGVEITPGPALVVPGIGPVDLEGQFFKSENYQIVEVEPHRFLLRCVGTTGAVAGVMVTLDQDGTFTRSGL